MWQPRRLFLPLGRRFRTRSSSSSTCPMKRCTRSTYWGTKLENRQTKLTAFLERIRQGHFPPNVSERTCAPAVRVFSSAVRRPTESSGKSLSDPYRSARVAPIDPSCRGVPASRNVVNTP